jgi:hypothetical protein
MVRECLEGPGIVAALMSASAQRLAVLGPPSWLATSSPASDGRTLACRPFEVMEGGDVARTLSAVRAFAPDVTVVLDPACLPAAALRTLPGTTLGVIVGGPERAGLAEAADALDRVLSFRPELTATALGSGRVWRAIPPPIADGMFAAVRPPHGRPRTMAIGRATEYREHVLLPAKHHHDVLQLISGVDGPRLAELMGEYDVGVYVPPAYGGGFGAQAGLHLAAGQLLLAHQLEPAHGLERGIDYLPFESREDLVWMLDRLGRFPEMYQRVRIRGRMKADGFRASRVFARVLHDLAADVAAFGASRS